MGEEMRVGLGADPEIEIIGGCDPRASSGSVSTPGVITRTLEELLAQASVDVVVDFTTAEAAVGNARTALGRAIPIVIGTTGLSEAELDEIEHLAREHQVGALVAPNF